MMDLYAYVHVRDTRFISRVGAKGGLRWKSDPISRGALPRPASALSSGSCAFQVRSRRFEPLPTPPPKEPRPTDAGGVYLARAARSRSPLPRSEE